MTERACGCAPEPQGGGKPRPDRNADEIIKWNPESGLYYSMEQFHFTSARLNPGFHQKYWDEMLVTVHDPNRAEVNERLSQVLSLSSPKKKRGDQEEPRARRHIHRCI